MGNGRSVTLTTKHRQHSIGKKCFSSHAGGSDKKKVMGQRNPMLINMGAYYIWHCAHGSGLNWASCVYLLIFSQWFILVGVTVVVFLYFGIFN